MIRPAGPLPAVPPAPELPITAHAAQIADALRDHPVVVVAGETGSGKSTQLPRICLPRCLAHDGLVAHTQPRRIAAREVAARVASEMGSRLGELVGYKVRFGERTSADTRVKVLTDGMLLAEMVHDRDLSAYHTIIVDEAHERSINIDFLLGCLKRLLRRRPSLRVVVTSATIDTARFAEHFGHCPVVEVSGRSYSVEVLYRPRQADEGDDESLDAAIARGVGELWQRGPGDVLVFLPGEREIREASAYLSRRLGEGVELLPLYARLSPADQKRIFRPSSGRRVVLSTNVAETSLTVPGVRYVIDSGLARVSRYSATAKIQRLPVEKISRAAADQRKGRCGRVASGVCIRLYDEEDFAARPEYTDPEIARTSLASVVLTMKSLRLGEVADFPFIDPPDRRQVRAALRTLDELGALDAAGGLTRVGRELAALPVEPRVGRMLVEGVHRGCLAEMLVLAARLSVPDPRVTPAEELDKARRHHLEVPQADSDITAALALFRDYEAVRGSSSRRALERWCRDHYLAPFRMREWADLAEQLEALVRDARGAKNTEPASAEAVAIGFLAGHLSQVAMLGDDGRWRGTGNKVIHIHPSSRSFRAKPKFLVAAELVDSGKLYARQVLPVKPRWIEQAAGDRIELRHDEPWWDARSGQVMALRSGRLFGLTLYRGRRVPLERVDPVTSRVVFIHQALVSGEMGEHFDFARANRALLDEAEAARQKLRQPFAMVDDDDLFDFFDRQLPARVTGRPALARWLKQEPAAARALCLPRERVLPAEAADHQRSFPETVTVGATALPVRYRHAPGEAADGVSVSVPLPMLNQFDADACARQIPGHLAEYVEALLRTLPKSSRRRLQPLAARARVLAAMVEKASGALPEALAATLRADPGIEVSARDFDPARVPEHLRLHLVVVDQQREVIDTGRDAEALRQRHGGAARAAFSDAAADGYPRTGLLRWDFGDLPEAVSVRGYGTRVKAFPALVDRETHVDLVLEDEATCAARRHRRGVSRLAALAWRRRFRDLLAHPDLKQAVLRYAGLYPGASLADAYRDAVVEAAAGFQADPPRRQADFLARLAEAEQRLGGEAARVAGVVEQAVSAAFTARRALPGIADAALREQLDGRIDALVGPGFPSRHPADWLDHLPRFAKALAIRVERLAGQGDREAEQRAKLAPFEQRLAGWPGDDEATWRYRYLLEEYHVSLFAQVLKTARPVSPKRLEQAWRDVLAAARD